MEMYKFGSDDTENNLAMDPSRAELLPYGAILLDTSGRVLKYNSVECGIAGRTPDQVLGKRFFEEVAPCAKGHVFYNHFFRAVSQKQINVIFDYTFDYKMEKTNVRIHMKSADTSRGIWVFVKRV